MKPLRTYLFASFCPLSLIIVVLNLFALADARPSYAAYEHYVQISGKTQGVITAKCGVRTAWRDFCASTNYSSSIGFPVDAPVPKYGTIQMVFDITKEPLFLNAMVQREPLVVSVTFIKINATGVEYTFHRVDLNDARIIDVRRWTDTGTTSSIGNMMTVTFSYATIAETNFDSGTTFEGAPK